MKKILKALKELEGVDVIHHQELGVVFTSRFGVKLDGWDISTSTKLVVLALSGYKKYLPLTELGGLHMYYLIKHNIACNLYGNQPIYFFQEVADLDLEVEIRLNATYIKTYGEYINCLYKGDF